MPPPITRPTGTVTFLFTDIEGSTKLVQRFGDAWPALLERHRQALRTAFRAHAGHEQGTEGDSFFVVFASARDALAAAVAGQQALAAEDWPDDGALRVRMGLHTGEGRLSGGDYVGLDVHRAARIAAVAHGGQVLASEPTAALARSALPPGVTLVELGRHRLKDLPSPEALWQVSIAGLPSAFPPLRTVGGSVANLPVALTSLVGREADIEAVRTLLRQSRLVTVTGPGGTGKTRVVQEVARQSAAEDEGGTTFVPLEALRDAGLIDVEILRALHLDTAADVAPRDRVVRALTGRPSLLVLDNLEQLDGSSRVVRELLEAVDGLGILASSQAALRLSGEREYALQPLPDSAAVRLFVERARAVRGDFEIDETNRAAVMAICERLDGLPLAIELAAAQVRLLPPAAILERISGRLDSLATRQLDLPERQRTLRAAVGWSYELLSQAEQALFRRLAVFVGGATLADIEAIESRRGRAGDALDTLEGLVDRSLVVVRRAPGLEQRFVQLETIGAVARELLAAAGEEPEARDDHAAVFEHLAADAEPQLYGPERRAWLDRLAADHGNLRAAIDHDVASGNLAGALEIAASIWRFWQTRGHLEEARARLSDLLARAGAREDLSPVLLSRVEEAAGGVAYWMRSVAADEIEPHYQRSLDLAQVSGDPSRQAWALYNLAFVYDFVAMNNPGKYDRDRGARLRLEALDLFRAAGDQRGIGESLWALGGNAVSLRENPELAAEQLREAAQILHSIGDSYGASWALASLGFIGISGGRPSDAVDPILRSARIFLEDDDLTGQLISIRALGAIAAAAGDGPTAVRLDAAAREMARRIDVDLPLIDPIIEPIEAARTTLSAEIVAREEEAATRIEARSFLEEAIADWEAGRGFAALGS
jgi:predicted ATPase/class 3 adenylate cyclase